MPCRGPSDREMVQMYRSEERAYPIIAEEMPATLCAVFTVLEEEGALRHVLEDADWAEAGVRRIDVEAWWRAHREADDLRRQREQTERKAVEERERAELRRLEAKYRGRGAS